MNKPEFEAGSVDRFTKKQNMALFVSFQNGISFQSLGARLLRKPKGCGTFKLKGGVGLEVVAKGLGVVQDDLDRNWF